MTVRCGCGYEPKNYFDMVRHAKLMADRQSQENHGAEISEWDITLCRKCGYPENETEPDLKDFYVCSECNNSRSHN